jgi:hypothetical protein
MAVDRANRFAGALEDKYGLQESKRAKEKEIDISNTKGLLEEIYIIQTTFKELLK